MRPRELARRLEMRAPEVGFAVERGEATANEYGYHSLNEFLSSLPAPLLPCYLPLYKSSTLWPLGVSVGEVS